MMNEYRVTVSIADHGRSAEAAEAVLDSFVELYPECGPVVSQDLRTGFLSITLAFDATDPWAATNKAKDTFPRGLAHSRIEVAEVVSVEVTTVDEDESGDYVDEHTLVVA